MVQVSDVNVAKAVEVLGIKPHQAQDETQIYRAYSAKKECTDEEEKHLLEAYRILLFNLMVFKNQVGPEKTRDKKKRIGANPCPSCRGWGIKERYHWEILQIPCPTCKGSLKVKGKKCVRCSVKGKPTGEVKATKQTTKVNGYVVCSSCDGSGQKLWNNQLALQVGRWLQVNKVGNC